MRVFQQRTMDLSVGFYRLPVVHGYDHQKLLRKAILTSLSLPKKVRCDHKVVQTLLPATRETLHQELTFPGQCVMTAMQEVGAVVMSWASKLCGRQRYSTRPLADQRQVIFLRLILRLLGFLNNRSLAASILARLQSHTSAPKPMSQSFLANRDVGGHKARESICSSTLGA